MKPFRLLLSLLALAPLPAVCQTALTIRIGDQALPARELPQIHGDARLSADAFARQAAPALARHTARTNTEACAMICRAPAGGWIMTPITLGSHVGCSIVDNCAPGFQATGLTIHTHPLRGQYQANSVDQVFLKKGRSATGVQWRPPNPRRFSREDYASGPGYLVVGRWLYFQEGQGTQRTVSVAPPQ